MTPDVAAARPETSAAAERARMRRWAPFAIGTTVFASAALIVLFSLRSEQSMAEALASVDWRLLPLAVALHVAAHVFWAARYAMIAQAFGTPLSAFAGWRIVTAGVFGGALTPGKVGGEGVKMAILMRRGMSGADASRLLLTDRSADLVWFMGMGLISFVVLPPLFGDAASAARGFALVGTGFLGLFMLLLIALLAFPGPVGRLVHRTASGFARLLRRNVPDLEGRTHKLLADVRSGIMALLGRRPSVAVAALVLTAANWLVEFGALWAVLRGFGYDVPYWSVFFVGTVLILVANIPITPGGSGVAELAALALFSPIVPGISPLAILLWRGSTYYYDLSAGGAMASVLLPQRSEALARPHDNP